MPTINIDGTRVTVSDGFLTMSHDDQHNAVEQIAASLKRSPQVDATPNPADVQADEATVPGDSSRPLSQPPNDKVAPYGLSSLVTGQKPPESPGIAEGIGRAFSSGVPILGGLLNKADAATNAALAPALNPLFAPENQLLEENWSDRYAHSLRDQQGADQGFAAQHPVLDTGAKIAGGIASMAPALKAVPAAFGAAGTLPQRLFLGGGSGLSIGGLDAAARGGDVNKGAMWGGIFGAGAPLVGAGARAIFARPRAAPVNDIADAAARQGVDFPRIAASDSLVTQRLGSTLKELPVLGEPIVRASRTANEQMGNALERVEQGYGSGSVLNGGEVAKKGLTDWIGPGADAVNDRAYGNLDKFVKPNVTSDLDATRRVIAEIAAKRQAAALGSSKAVDHVLEGVQRPGGLTADGLKTLRTSVGEKLKDSLLPSDISKSELKRLYGSLSQDLDKAIFEAGKRQRSGRFQKQSLAPDAFEKANTLASKINDRREELAKIVGNDASAAPERVMDRLIGFASGSSRADANKLLLARKAIGGENWNEVASAVVSKMGRDADGKFSPERFLTAYGKMSEPGKKLIFRSTGKGDLADALEDIATLSRKAKELSALGNPSGTGRVLGPLSMAGAAFTHPHLAIPVGIGARAAATALAEPLRPTAAILKVAQRNQDIADLVGHVLRPTVAGSLPVLANQPGTPRRTSRPSIQAIR